MFAQDGLNLHILHMPTGTFSLHRPISFCFCFFVLQIADLQQEHQREMEGLLENVRQLSRELKLQMLIIDNFIPPEYQVNFIFQGPVVQN